MRQLSTIEAAQVAGGNDFMDTVQDFTTFGATTGSFIGYVTTATVLGATRGGVIGGAFGFAFGIGYATGTAIWNYYC